MLMFLSGTQLTKYKVKDKEVAKIAIEVVVAVKEAELVSLLLLQTPLF